jgi:hypothetical protein
MVGELRGGSEENVFGQERELAGADAAAPGEFRERPAPELPLLNRSMDCVQTKSGRRSRSPFMRWRKRSRRPSGSSNA